MSDKIEENLNSESDSEEEIEEDSEERKLIDEEYRVWKKNSPFLYDFVMTYELEWPSLTFQWLPENNLSIAKKEKYYNHKFILGTQSDGVEPNYLMIGEVLLPSENVEIDARKFDDERSEVGGFGGLKRKIDIKVKIPHQGDVHRARYMPQDQYLIATRSQHPDVLVFDYSKHSSIPSDLDCKPQYRLTNGHTDGGYGLAWNPKVKGQLLTGSLDSTVCLWDINEAGETVSPLLTFNGHTAGVEDCDWSHFHPSVFGTVGDDSAVIIWDCRDSSNAYTGTNIVKKVENAHLDNDKKPADINCISFHAYNEYLFATGGSDGAVKIWDMRNMSRALHSLDGHEAGVYQVKWAPHEESVLASSSEDRRINIWDTSRIGEEQTPEEAEEGPPELLFVHGGHTSKIFDFDFNPSLNWFIGSVSEDNGLHIWQMAETIYEDYSDNEEINDDDLEDENVKNKRPRI